MKFLSIILITVGEGLAIYVEMLFARRFDAMGHSVLVPALVGMTIAGGCLAFGYATSYASFKNIWIVSAISLTSIFIIEPILAWSFFKEVPSRGALIGLICGAIGMLAAVFIP